MIIGWLNPALACFERKLEESSMNTHDIAHLPTFGGKSDIKRLCLTTPGLQHLHAVLSCLAFEHTEALYCPFLPVFAACCLHWLSPKETFAVCMATLREPSPLFETRLQSWLMLIAFHDLASEKVPQAVKTLCEVRECAYPPPIDQNHPCSGAVLDWVADRLPFWLLMRFVDNFIVEGEKTFYRFNLAILQLWYYHSSPSGVSKSFYKNPISVNTMSSNHLAAMGRTAAHKALSAAHTPIDLQAGEVHDENLVPELSSSIHLKPLSPDTEVLLLR